MTIEQRIPQYRIDRWLEAYKEFATSMIDEQDTNNMTWGEEKEIRRAATEYANEEVSDLKPLVNEYLKLASKVMRNGGLGREYTTVERQIRRMLIDTKEVWKGDSLVEQAANKLEEIEGVIGFVPHPQIISTMNDRGITWGYHVFEEMSKRGWVLRPVKVGEFIEIAELTTIHAATMHKLLPNRRNNAVLFYLADQRPPEPEPEPEKKEEPKKSVDELIEEMPTDQALRLMTKMLRKLYTLEEIRSQADDTDNS